MGILNISNINHKNDLINNYKLKTIQTSCITIVSNLQLQFNYHCPFTYMHLHPMCEEAHKLF